MSSGGSSSIHTPSRVSACHLVRPWSYELNWMTDSPPYSFLTVTDASASATPCRMLCPVRCDFGIEPVPHSFRFSGGPTSSRCTPLRVSSADSEPTIHRVGRGNRYPGHQSGYRPVGWDAT